MLSPNPIFYPGFFNNIFNSMPDTTGLAPNLNSKAVSANTFDAIVVGSGISGGWAAKELTEKGLRTLVLERGRPVEHIKDYVTEHVPDYAFNLRQRRITPDSPLAQDYQVQARTGQFVEAAVHFFVKDSKHPYTEDKPFTWIQGDQVGG